MVRKEICDVHELLGIRKNAFAALFLPVNVPVLTHFYPCCQWDGDTVWLLLLCPGPLKDCLYMEILSRVSLAIRKANEKKTTLQSAMVRETRRESVT